MTMPTDLNTFAGRLCYLAQQIGGGAELARKAGLSQSTLSRIMRGKDANLSNILKLCRYLHPEQVAIEWLLLGSGDAHKSLPLPSHLRLSIYGEEHEANTYCPIFFERHWFLSTISRYPNRCLAFQALDSEILCIERNAWIIVDTGIQHGDGLYLIMVKNVPMIRRLQFMPTGEINVRTNGEAYKNYMLDSQQQRLLQILGRVMWWEHQ
jgi:transcriptional regulator with XRE-family HTH domain